jgi:hypothetical protein
MTTGRINQVTTFQDAARITPRQQNTRYVALGEHVPKQEFVRSMSN